MVSRGAHGIGSVPLRDKTAFLAANVLPPVQRVPQRPLNTNGSELAYHTDPSRSSRNKHAEKLVACGAARLRDFGGARDFRQR
jgi:hypothetical protein